MCCKINFYTHAIGKVYTFLYLCLPKPPMSKKKSAVPDNPYPVKLGDKKQKLQQIAFENERSLHWIINKTLQALADGTIKMTF